MGTQAHCRQGGDRSGSLTAVSAIPLLAFLMPLVFAGEAATSPDPPESRRDHFVEVLHGVSIPDPYRWLEDQNSSETREWIEQQNRYTHSLLDSLPVCTPIRGRLEELMRIDRLTAPSERNGRYFFWSKRAGDDLWILNVRYGLDGEDQVLIDPHGLSPDHTVDVSLMDVSTDGSLILYGVRQGGEDEIEIHTLNVETRADLPGSLPRALYYGASLNGDNSGFYYSLHDRNKGGRIYYHAMGTDSAEDEEVFGGTYGPKVGLDVLVSENGRYLLITVEHGWTRTELYFKDIATDGPLTPLVTDLDALFYPVFAGDYLLLQTDWNAPNGRVLLVNLTSPSRDNWREIVPTGGDAINGITVAGEKLFVHYLRSAASRIDIFTVAGNPQGEIPLPELCTVGGPWGRWKSSDAFFDVWSFTRPRTTYHYDVESGLAQVWARDDVPIDSDLFHVEQVWYSSKDTTKIPMFIVHKKGLELTGNTPTLLYGYGGFNYSLTPWFSSGAALWLESGGVFAVANLRGGGEFGEAWHRAGMLEKKQNVFDDFIAASEWLIEHDYTNPSRLAIQGGSNGGLLVGAALTQRPDLYQAVLCDYPDLDMIGYHRFEKNNPPALLEYGDASNPDHFPFLYAYSPYHRVVEGTSYPAVLFTTGDADTRVPPLQARKMTALLQASTVSDRPVLLLYDTKAGHSGGKPASGIIDELTLKSTFIFWQLGVHAWQNEK